MQIGKPTSTMATALQETQPPKPVMPFKKRKQHACCHLVKLLSDPLGRYVARPDLSEVVAMCKDHDTWIAVKSFYRWTSEAAGNNKSEEQFWSMWEIQATLLTDALVSI